MFFFQALQGVRVKVVWAGPSGAGPHVFDGALRVEMLCEAMHYLGHRGTDWVTLPVVLVVGCVESDVLILFVWVEVL